MHWANKVTVTNSLLPAINFQITQIMGLNYKISQITDK